MLISVVICTLNRPDDLRRALRYFEGNTEHQPFEVIVVDQSEQPADLSRFSGVRAVHRTERSMTKARNAGIGLAKGDIILFVDDDVDILPGFLTAHAAAYRDSDVWGATGPVFSPTGSRDLISKESLPAGLSRTEMACKNTNFEYEADWMIGCNMSIRKSVFDHIGFFDEFMEVSGDDADISNRIVRAGGHMRFMPGAQLVHHQRQTGGTRIDPVSSAAYIRKFVRDTVLLDRKVGRSLTRILSMFRTHTLSRHGYHRGRIAPRPIAAFWLGVLDGLREFERRRRSAN